MPANKAKTVVRKDALSFSSAERELLLEILRESLGSLREQVYHADTASFKDALKAKESLLKGLISKL